MDSFAFLVDKAFGLPSSFEDFTLEKLALGLVEGPYSPSLLQVASSLLPYTSPSCSGLTCLGQEFIVQADPYRQLH